MCVDSRVSVCSTQGSTHQHANFAWNIESGVLNQIWIQLFLLLLQSSPPPLELRPSLATHFLTDTNIPSSVVVVGGVKRKLYNHLPPSLSLSSIRRENYPQIWRRGGGRRRGGGLSLSIESRWKTHTKGNNAFPTGCCCCCSLRLEFKFFFILNYLPCGFFYILVGLNERMGSLRGDRFRFEEMAIDHAISIAGATFISWSWWWHSACNWKREKRNVELIIYST